MTLKLHNTLTKKLEEFTPQDNNKVLLYTCGPTVYNRLHVGNWWAYVYWDILVRTLLANDYTVERVMNITDVGHLTGENEGDADTGEDKMQKGARREGKTAWEVAEYYAEDFLSGMEKLGLLLPEHITKATDFIPQQLDLVRILKDKGLTYQTTDGIYFDTSKFPSYATFANLDLSAQKAGARVEINTEKRNPSDFALWKFSPTHEQRDMEWPTPDELLDLPAVDDEKVMGFPGWHLECSAMAMSVLGTTLDIHTGGIDHIQVHHTNEIAQSESASGVKFANYWLHNNHLKADGTKISKSLGNGYTLQDLTERGYTALDYRMFVLQSHYRSEGNFTFDNLTAAKNRLHNWRNIAALRHQTHDTLVGDGNKTISLIAASQAIVEAINNDLNTPEALRAVDQAFAQFDGKDLSDIHQHGLNHVLDSIDSILGLQLVASTPDINDDVKQLIIKRQRARDEKDWATSDQIRDQILEKGVVLRDTSKGSIWEYAADI